MAINSFAVDNFQTKSGDDHRITIYKDPNDPPQSIELKLVSCSLRYDGGTNKHFFSPIIYSSLSAQFHIYKQHLHFFLDIISKSASFYLTLEKKVGQSFNVKWFGHINEDSISYKYTSDPIRLMLRADDGLRALSTETRVISERTHHNFITYFIDLLSRVPAYNLYESPGTIPIFNRDQFLHTSCNTAQATNKITDAPLVTIDSPLNLLTPLAYNIFESARLRNFNGYFADVKDNEQRANIYDIDKLINYEEILKRILQTFGCRLFLSNGVFKVLGINEIKYFSGRADVFKYKRDVEFDYTTTNWLEAGNGSRVVNFVESRNKDISDSRGATQAATITGCPATNSLVIAYQQPTPYFQYVVATRSSALLDQQVLYYPGESYERFRIAFTNMYIKFDPFPSITGQPGNMIIAGIPPLVSASEVEKYYDLFLRFKIEDWPGNFYYNGEEWVSKFRTIPPLSGKDQWLEIQIPNSAISAPRQFLEFSFNLQGAGVLQSLFHSPKVTNFHLQFRRNKNRATQYILGNQAFKKIDVIDGFFIRFGVIMLSLDEAKSVEYSTKAFCSVDSNYENSIRNVIYATNFLRGDRYIAGENSNLEIRQLRNGNLEWNVPDKFYIGGITTPPSGVDLSDLYNLNKLLMARYAHFHCIGNRIFNGEFDQVIDMEDFVRINNSNSNNSFKFNLIPLDVTQNFPIGFTSGVFGDVVEVSGMDNLYGFPGDTVNEAYAKNEENYLEDLVEGPPTVVPKSPTDIGVTKAKALESDTSVRILVDFIPIDSTDQAFEEVLDQVMPG